MSEELICNSCAKSGAKPFEYCIREDWFLVHLCDDCTPLLMNAFRPLVRISQPIDTSRAARYNGRITRTDIETGSMKAVGSTPSAPLLMGLRVMGGVPDLIGRVVQTKLTEDEVLEIAAFLISRPHWAHTIEAMLAQRTEVHADADMGKDAIFKRKLVQAGRRALTEVWRGRERKAG